MKITFGGNEVKLIGKEIKVGDVAPSFKATKNDLSEYNSEDYKGDIVIYSIAPSIDTPVCSLQARTFNEKVTELTDDIHVVTITVDLPFAQQRFCAAQGIDKAEIVSDYKNREFGEKYGFLMDGLMLLARGVVIVDRDGKVSYVEYVPEVTHEVNFDAAMEAAKKLK